VPTDVPPHRTDFSRVVPCQWVPSVIHRCRRMAPIIVRVAPQSIARGSTYSSPRRIHTCERLIVRCAPASSTQTKQSASIARGYVPNWPPGHDELELIFQACADEQPKKARLPSGTPNRCALPMRHPRPIRREVSEG
jgi:hypothetical protein